MKSRERNEFTPSDLCSLIAHETAAILYGVGAAVHSPIQRERKILQELAVTLVNMGGLSDILLRTPLPDGPCLTAADLRFELAEVSAALEQRNSQSAVMEVSM